MKNKPVLVKREMLERHLIHRLAGNTVDKSTMEAIAQLIKEGAITAVEEIEQLLAEAPGPRKL